MIVMMNTENDRSVHESVAIPHALLDVALIDAPGIAVAGCMSVSQWHTLVRLGKAPAPAIRSPRFTRWRVADVRAFLLALSAGDASVAAGARQVLDQAMKASK